jgi:hypothetical protein
LPLEVFQQILDSVYAVKTGGDGKGGKDGKVGKVGKVGS